jgi:ribosome maturation factor RimP
VCPLFVYQGVNNMSITKDRIEALITDSLESYNAVMVQAQISGNPRKPMVQLFIDCKDEPMTINKCATIARDIRDVLSLQDDIPRDYRLEVSSPGIDWPLSELWQFKKNIGRQVQITVDNKDVIGSIMGVSDDDIIDIQIEGMVKEFKLESLIGTHIVVGIK